MQEAYEFLSQGGPVMVPILLCSLIAVTIFLERLWALQRQRIVPEQFLKLLTRAMRDARWDRARSLCDGNTSTVATIARSGLAYRGRSRTVIKDAVQESGRRAAAALERFTGALGSIASIAPLLGLLGTVTGMIGVFQQVVSQLGDEGQINAGALANGIWEALITTAAGLSVAIPAFLMYRFLISRIDGLVLELEEHAGRIVDMVADEGPMDLGEDEGSSDTESESEAAQQEQGA